MKIRFSSLVFLIMSFMIAPHLQAQHYPIQEGPIRQFEQKLEKNKSLLINKLLAQGLYKNLSPEQLLQQTYQQTMIELDSLENFHSAKEAQILQYYYAHQWAQIVSNIPREMSRNGVPYRLSAQSLLPLPMPELTLLKQSQYARYYLQDYMQLQFLLFFIQFSEEGETILRPRLGIGIDSLRAFANQYGEVNVIFLLGESTLTPDLHAVYLVDLIAQATHQEQKQNVAYLYEKYQRLFPNHEDQEWVKSLVKKYEHTQHNWQPTILYNAVEGIHLKKNFEEIKMFWQEALQDTNVSTGYPTYMLFDRNGKVVNTDAPSPSQTQKLRTLFHQYLAKK